MSIIARGLPLTVRNSIDEAIQNSADNLQNILSQTEQRLTTTIEQTKNSITSQVSQ